MEVPRGEPPLDLVLEEEFRLWRTALVDHGHVLPGGDPPGVSEMALPPVPVVKPAPPVAVQAEHPPANELGGRGSRRWAAVILFGALIAAISVASYRDFSDWRTAANRPVAVPSPAVSPPVHSPQTDRTAPLDQADLRRADLADNVAHAGEVLALSGDAAGALRLYRQSLAIRRELAARNPSDATMQQARASGWDKVADAFAAQGDTTRALGAYREAEAAWQLCARVRPEDRAVQRNWSLTALSLGNLLLARNDPAAAAEAFRRGTSIQELLCRQEPNNAGWQEDLALGWLRLSDALDQRGDDEAALQACLRALTIDEALVTQDPANVAWQGDLATAHGKAGDLLLARNEVDAALQEYDAASACWKKLAAAAADPERRRAVAETQDRIGQVLEVKKQLGAALPFYRQALGIVADLSAEDPANHSFESFQAVVCYHLGRAMARCQPVDRRPTRAALREACDRLNNMKSANGTFPYPEQAEMLADVERLLAELDK